MPMAEYHLWHLGSIPEKDGGANAFPTYKQTYLITCLMDLSKGHSLI